MSNRKIVKRQKKKGGETKEHNSPSSSIVLCRLMHKIPTNQQEGKETGKESIWLNQSIYKCTKVYTIYNEGAASLFSGVFFILFLSILSVFVFGEEVFCQRLNWQKSARPLSVRKSHPDCIVFFVVASTTPHGEYGILHGTEKTKKRNKKIKTSVPFLLPVRGNNNNNTQTFVYCMQQKLQTLPLFWNCVCKSYIFTCRRLDRKSVV